MHPIEDVFLKLISEYRKYIQCGESLKLGLLLNEDIASVTLTHIAVKHRESAKLDLTIYKYMPMEFPLSEEGTLIVNFITEHYRIPTVYLQNTEDGGRITQHALEATSRACCDLMVMPTNQEDRQQLIAQQLMAGTPPGELVDIKPMTAVLVGKETRFFARPLWCTPDKTIHEYMAAEDLRTYQIVGLTNHQACIPSTHH